MTSYTQGTTRFFSTLEEAKANKPQDKPTWEIFYYDVVDNRDGSPTKGQVLRVYGASGGLAVLQAQVCNHFKACVGGKAEGKRGGDSAALEAERQKTATLEQQLAALQAQLQAMQGAQTPPAAQPVEEPKPRGKKG